jgi:beta-galactosidase/beta-glucuronidase
VQTSVETPGTSVQLCSWVMATPAAVAHIDVQQADELLSAPFTLTVTFTLSEAIEQASWQVCVTAHPCHVLRTLRHSGHMMVCWPHWLPMASE